MEYRLLGATGIRVSRLCLGALTIGPLQLNLPVEMGAEVILRALELGVNFIDTSQFYRVYPPIARALQLYSGRDEVIIATKSYAYDAAGMEAALEEALRELGRDYIDIFLLHEQESMLTIQGHWEAVEYLLKAKEKGLVRAVGISTHYIQGVRAAALVPEFDVISPLINCTGVGIADGTREEMEAAIQFAAQCGKGIYAMKPLGGGHLLDRLDEAFGYLLAMEELASIAVGMRNQVEVEINVRLFEGREVPDSLRAAAKAVPRRLHVEDWCIGCGNCVERCSSKAMALKNGKAEADPSRCALCGYCGAHCPEFAIKVI
ncbi:MAG: aldo/keto reductase [Firmicutes bacterium]|nr:aldo/keto reductase [Bacillota bacterium]